MGGKSGAGSRRSGFTLIEMGIVLVVAGILISLGSMSWLLLVEGRKNSSTLATMRRARDCIENYVIQTGRYPAYSANLSTDPNAAVNICLQGKQDAWGQQILFLEGIRDGGGTLADLCVLPTDTASSSDPCSPSHTSNPPIKTDTTSRMVDKDGNTISDVAFVLISYGKGLHSDHTSYGNRLDPTVAGTYANQMTTTPDFSTSLLTGEDDDLYLVVTYPELVAEVSKGRL